MRILRIAVLTLLVQLVGCASCEASTSSGTNWQAAQAAYMQFDLAGSWDLFEKVAQDSHIDIEDRGRAMRKLALMEWKFNKDIVKAKDWAHKALKAGEETWATYIVLSRIELEAGNVNAAKEAAYQAEIAAESNAEKKYASIRFAEAVLKAAEQAKDGGEALLKQDLHQAMTDLSKVLDEEPGERSSSDLLLGIALRLGNGPMALKAWRSFYMVPDGEHADGIMASPCGTLETLLPGWVDRPLAPSEQEEIVLALADSYFYKYAAWLASNISSQEGTEHMNENHRIREIVVYSQYLEHLRDITNEYYRKTALSMDMKDEFTNEFKTLSQELWKKLYFTDARPVFSDVLFRETLRERFGTVITSLGYTGGYFGFAMGHVVVDDHRTIVQYGEEAVLAFIALDHMVSNFYTSWFWDGAAASGGWAEPDTIFQVREAYAMGPFFEWRLATDPVERARIEEEIEKKNAQDDMLARKNPYAYLPGLDLRMKLAYWDRILQTVDKKGHKGSARCLAFINEYKRIKLAYSIFAHEGRHSIDQRMHPDFTHWSRHEKEFRAKLSQIAFSPDPQMAFCDVLCMNIGGDTAHGQANLRVVENLVEWMNQHRQGIKGLDPDRPLLPQFDLLTAEQIRSAVKSMDPLYLKEAERSNN